MTEVKGEVQCVGAVLVNAQSNTGHTVHRQRHNQDDDVDHSHPIAEVRAARGGEGMEGGGKGGVGEGMEGGGRGGEGGGRYGDKCGCRLKGLAVANCKQQLPLSNVVVCALTDDRRAGRWRPGSLPRSEPACTSVSAQ